MLSTSVARGASRRAWLKLAGSSPDLQLGGGPSGPLGTTASATAGTDPSYSGNPFPRTAPAPSRSTLGTAFEACARPERSLRPPWPPQPARGFASQGAEGAVSRYLSRVPGYTATSKALHDTRERIQKAKTQLSTARTAAYGHLPVAVQQVIESSSQERSKVAALHFDAFWQSYGRIVTMASGGAGTLILWKILSGVGGMFGDIQGTTSAFLLVTSAASVLGGLQYARYRHSIDPDAVYSSAMRQLNSHIGVLEAMGAPLVGTEMRAHILTGGGLRLQGLVPRFRSHRLKMVFLLRGADARGLVAVDAKRWKGETVFHLLALDIPAADGNHVRIFLHGMPSQFQKDGIFDEMYQPLRTATKLRAADDAEDDKAIARASFSRDAMLPKSLTQGGGMYPWERAVEAYHSYRQKLQSLLR